MEAEERNQQQAAVTGTSDKHPLLTEECWLDEDYHVPGEAKVLPSDPWDDLPLPCDQRDDAVGRTAADHRVCAAEQPAGIAARMTPAFSQEQARSGEEEVQATTSRLGSRAELPSQPPADAEAPPQLQREAVSPAWQAFMEAIRSGGSQRKHKRERSNPPRPVSASAKADTVAADVPYEKDDWWFDRHLLDGDWLEEADWGEGEGDEVPGSESAPDAWWELDDFQDEQQDPWLWEAEEEPRHRRAARAKAADIVRLLDLHTAAGRDEVLRLLTGLFEEFQHHATFRAINDLASSDPCFENLQRAVELRRVWADRPDWWKSRSYGGYSTIANGSLALSWKLAHRLAAARPELDPAHVISEDWLEEWYRLQPGDAGYLRFPEFLAHKAKELEASLLFAGLVSCEDDPVHPEAIDDPLFRRQLRDVTGAAPDLFRTSWPFDERALAIRLPPQPATPVRPARLSESHQSDACSEASVDDQEVPEVDPGEECHEGLSEPKSARVEEAPRSLRCFPALPRTIAHMEYGRLDRTMTIVDTTGYIRVYRDVPAEVCERMFACEDVSAALQELRAGYDVLIKSAD